MSRRLVTRGVLVFLTRRLGGESPPPAARLGIRVFEAQAGDAAWLLGASDPGRTRAAIEARFARGHRCFAAAAPDGSAAHTRWTSTTRTRIAELGLDIVPAPGEAWVYDVFTRPDLRGLGIDAVVRHEVFRALRVSAIRRVWSGVATDNAASLHAALRWEEPVRAVPFVAVLGRPLRAGARHLRGAPRLERPGPIELQETA